MMAPFRWFFGWKVTILKDGEAKVEKTASKIVRVIAALCIIPLIAALFGAVFGSYFACRSVSHRVTYLTARGRQYLNGDDPEEIKEKMQKIVTRLEKIAHENRHAWILALHYYYEYCFGEPELDKCDELIEKLESLNSDDPFVMETIGRFKIKTHDTEYAKRTFQELGTTGDLGLAHCAFYSKDYEKAKERYEELRHLQLSRNIREEATAYLAFSEYHLGNEKEAKGIIERCDLSKLASPLRKKVEVYRMLTNRDRDPNYYERVVSNAITSDPLWTFGYILLAKHYFRNSDLKKSAEVWQALRDLDPENVEACEGLGNIAMRIKKYSSALEWFESARAFVKDNTKRGEFCCRQADCCAAMKKKEEEIIYLEIAIEFGYNPWDYRLGMIYFETKRYEKALLYLQKLVLSGEMGELNGEILGHITEAYNGLEKQKGLFDRTGALTFINSFLEKWPESTAGLLFRSRLHSQAHFLDEAIADTSKGIELIGDRYPETTLAFLIIRRDCYLQQGKTAEAEADRKRIDELFKKA